MDRPESQPRIPVKKKNFAWGTGCLITIGAILLIIACAVAAYVIYLNQQPELTLLAKILKPGTGTETEVNTPLMIQAMAGNDQGVSRLEVYADGALILAHDAAQEGVTPLLVDGTWVPLTSGRHVLLARAYAADNRFIDSSVVYVDVADPLDTIDIDVDNLPRPPGASNPSLSELASGLGTTPEELARRNPTLGGTDPTSPLPPGTRVEGPRPPAPPASPPPSSPPAPPARPGAPAAPTNLNATADCSSVTLTWRDSPDEDRYKVNRIDPLGIRPVSIGGAPQNATTFRDGTIPPGSGGSIYTYQVVPVRNVAGGALEGPGPMIRVTIPRSCPGPSASDLVLTVAMLQTDATWMGTYCFVRIDDRSPDTRVPAGSDFNYIIPESINSNVYLLTRLPGRNQFNLTGHPTASPVRLRFECLGRTTLTANPLGFVEVSHPSSDWNGNLRTARGGNFTMSYCLGPSSVPCNPAVPFPTVRFSCPPICIPTLFMPSPTNLRLTTGLRAYTDPTACAGIPFPASIGCLSRNTTIRNRQILNWNWIAAPPDFPESSLTAYHVEMTDSVPIMGTAVRTEWDVGRTGGSLERSTVARLEDIPCGHRISYQVSAVSGGTSSALSAPLEYRTPMCTPSTIRTQLRVSFDTLQLFPPISDNPGDWCPTGMPGCPNNKSFLDVGLTLQAIDSRGNVFSREMVGSGSTPYNRSEWYYVAMPAGSYDLSAQRFTGAYNPPPEPAVLNGSTGSNHITLLLGPTDSSVIIQYSLVDHDLNQRFNETICTDSITLTASPSEWASMNRNIDLGSTGTPCRITVNVSGEPYIGP